MFAANVREKVSTISCLVESGSPKPANVADSILAPAVPLVTMGEATTTIGPLTKKARPVAVRVRRPAASRIRGSVTVIPLTVIGEYDCAACVSSSSVRVTVMPLSLLAVGEADDGEERVSLGGDVGTARAVS